MRIIIALASLLATTAALRLISSLDLRTDITAVDVHDAKVLIFVVKNF